jgi:hypothetical protein
MGDLEILYLYLTLYDRQRKRDTKKPTAGLGPFATASDWHFRNRQLRGESVELPCCVAPFNRGASTRG